MEDWKIEPEYDTRPSLVFCDSFLPLFLNGGITRDSRLFERR